MTTKYASISLLKWNVCSCFDSGVPVWRAGGCTSPATTAHLRCHLKQRESARSHILLLTNHLPWWLTLSLTSHSHGRLIFICKVNSGRRALPTLINTTQGLSMEKGRSTHCFKINSYNKFTCRYIFFIISLFNTEHFYLKRCQKFRSPLLLATQRNLTSTGIKFITKEVTGPCTNGSLPWYSGSADYNHFVVIEAWATKYIQTVARHLVMLLYVHEYNFSADCKNKMSAGLLLWNSLLEEISLIVNYSN